ncbi:MAG: protein kinase [Verrucomicrobiota bacterium]
MKDSLSDADFLKAYSEASLELGEFDQFRDEIESTRYLDEEFVSEGGIKRVYKAFDSTGKRTVARAFPKSEESKYHDTFVREARLHTQLEHPNIIPIYDMGVEEGKPYFSMKYIDGGTLHEYIEEMDPAVRQSSEHLNSVFDIFLKVCDAVSYAHSKNILHLDIKPKNIYLNEYGEVYVGDWGLSRVVDPILLEEKLSYDSLGQCTFYGHLTGTPGFMAPEQCQKGAKKGYTSDIYSLAVLLVYLLTGKMVVTGSPDEMIQKTIAGDLLQLDGLLDDRLCGVLEKALATDPSHRYPSVKEFLIDINAYRNGFLTSTEQFSVLKLAVAIYNRNRLASNLIIGFAVILFSISVFFVMEISQARDYALTQERISKERLEQYLESEEERSKTMTRAYGFLLSEGIDNYTRRKSGAGFSHENFLDAENMAKTALQFDPASPEAWALKGKIDLVYGRFKQAYEAFSKAGAGYETYQELCQFAESKDITQLPDLVAILNRIRSIDDNRLFNHMIFKEMYRPRPLPKQMEFVRAFLILRNNLDDSVHFQFDESRMALDLSTNPKLEILYMLQNLPLRGLDLSHSGVRTGDFIHLQNLPLESLDVSHTSFDDSKMKLLTNKPLEFLSLENCPVSNLRPLQGMPLTYLNVKGTNCSDFRVLKTLAQLETVVCSPSQKSAIEQNLPAGSQVRIMTQQ